MTDKEARRIIIQNTESLKANPLVTVDNCLYEAFDRAIQALEQQLCEDCISRQAVLDVINFEDKWLFEAKSHNADTHIAFSSLESRVKALPSVTPQIEPSEDCISRKAVLDTIGNVPDYDDGMVWEALSHAQRDVALLPPVTPERPKGKWIEVEVRNVYATLKCSVCGRVIEPIFDFCKYSYEDIKRSYPYCHCGAEMSGGGEYEKEA